MFKQLDLYNQHHTSVSQNLTYLEKQFLTSFDLICLSFECCNFCFACDSNANCHYCQILIEGDLGADLYLLYSVYDSLTTVLYAFRLFYLLLTEPNN